MNDVFFTNDKLKLKPHYSVTIKDNGYVIVSLPPFEFYGIKSSENEAMGKVDINTLVLKRGKDENRLFTELINGLTTIGVILDDFVEQRGLKKEEIERLKSIIGELWSAGLLMVEKDRQYSVEEKEWIYILSRFTNRPYESFDYAIEKKILCILDRRFGREVSEYIKSQFSIFRNFQLINLDETNIDVLNPLFEKNDYICALILGFRAHILLKLNEMAVNMRKMFTPVILINDSTNAIIGPTITEDAPCWNCFYRRYLSHSSNVRFIIDTDFEGEMLSSIYNMFMIKSLIHRLLPMTLVVLSENVVCPTIGNVIMANLIDGGWESHVVLRVPTCEHCGYKTDRKLPISPYLY